ncbi:6472_t:CDS:2, partial [Funneliformis caledonium]
MIELQAIGNSNTTQVRNNLASIDHNTLNNKQRIIFEKVEAHYIALTLNETVKLLRIIIMGIIAFNIQGSTIHSLLSIPICSTNYKLE